MRAAPVLQSNPKDPVGQPSAASEPVIQQAQPKVENDHFEAQQGAQPAVPSRPKPTEMDWVNALKLDIAAKKEAKLTADAIMTCLTPVLYGTGKGPLEVQIQALLMRIMGQMESTKRDDNFEQNRLEYLKKALRSKEALAELKKIEQTLAAERKSHAEEENRATEGFSSISRTLDEAIKAGLREMRAS